MPNGGAFRQPVPVLTPGACGATSIRMRPISPSAAAVVAALAASAGIARGQAVPLAPVRNSGQTVTPAFEGWYKNPDGTYALSFGYFNRNANEVVEIPVGPDNYFSPGPADRGQPTVFYPRRNWGVFAVTLPADAKVSDRIVWTLIVRGDTMRIPGHIRPQWQIDALEGEAGTGNTPPVIRFAEGGPAGAGPGGITTGPISARVGMPVELRAWVTDDGNARNSVASGGRQGAPVTLRWFKHSGPGAVVFANPAPRASGAAGLATTTATFSAPGDYVVRLRVNDASGVVAGGHAQCCWSNGFVRVTVVP